MIVTQPAVVIKTQDAPDMMTPFMLGALDADLGLLCCPEEYYIRQGDKCEYCEGYESIAGETLTTCQVLGKRFIDPAAELEDLIDARLDNEFWASGAW